MTKLTQADRERAREWASKYSSYGDLLYSDGDINPYELAEWLAAYAQAERERQRSMEWINVSERLPETGTIVLIYTNEGHIESAWRCFDGRDEIFQLERTGPQDEPITFEVSSERVTHWQPLPPPPSAGT